MQEIFDRNAIFKRLESINFDSTLYKRVEEQVLEELNDYIIFFCNKTVESQNITQILPHSFLSTKYNAFILEQNDKLNIGRIKNLKKNDVMIAINSLHNVNYLQEYLVAIFENLNDGGVFCGNFFGRNNILELKKIIHENDAKHSKEVYPRFNPALLAENLYAILQGVGFQNVVISIEKIIFNFASFKDSMVFLRNINERNYTICRQKNAPKKQIFQEGLQEKVKLDFEIIKFYCHKK